MRIRRRTGLSKVELRRVLDERLAELERGEGIKMNDAALDKRGRDVIGR